MNKPVVAVFGASHGFGRSLLRSSWPTGFRLKVDGLSSWKHLAPVKPSAEIFEGFGLVCAIAAPQFLSFFQETTPENLIFLCINADLGHLDCLCKSFLQMAHPIGVEPITF